MRRLLALLVALGLTGAAWVDEPGPTVEFVDITDYPVIGLVFTPPEGLRDAALDETRVELHQDGEPVEIVMTSLEQEPVEVVLLLDTSGSMAGRPLIDAAGAARDFIERLPADSDIAVVTFGAGASVVAPFGSDRGEILTAIADTTAGGETAMHDAIVAAVDLIETAPLSRQFMLLLSDGGDTQSIASLDEAVAALESVDVGFFAIALRSSEYDLAALETLRVSTDGRLVEADASEGLDEIYAGIADELAAQYALAFRAHHGGESTFTLAIEGPTGRTETSFSLILPADPIPEPEVTDDGPAVAFPTPTLTSPTTRSVTPPTARVVGPVGALGETWAKWVGALAFFAVLITVLWLALVPGEPRRRRGVLDGSPIAHAVGETDPGRVRRIVTALQQRLGQALERDGRRHRVTDTLEAAGIPLAPGEFVLLSLGGAAVAGVAGLLAGLPVLGVVLGALVLGSSRAIAERRARIRRARFDDQLEGTLQLVSGALRAGYGITQAINTVATEAPEPTAGEFARVVTENRLGRDLIDSLRSVADRMDNVDFVWVTEAIDIQQGVGGDLAQILDTVGKTIRERNRIRRQVHALSAEGRMSAAVLIGLPFAIAGLIAITNPDYLNELTGTVAGRILLLVGAALMGLGIVWIRKIIRIEY